MLEFSVFRRPLAALAFCSVAVVVSAPPATARSHHSAYRHHRGAYRYAYAGYRTHMSRRAALARLREYAHTRVNVMPAGAEGGSASSLVMEARQYLGTNPTSRGSLWCARFMNMVLERTGHRGTGSDMANSFAHYGHRISGPQIGAISR